MKSNFSLGINTGFAVNRYSEHDQWIKIIGKDLNLKNIQLTADILNPSLTDEIIEKHIYQINNNCKKFNTKVTSTFTGAFTRVNHLAHPDILVRKFWLNWFKRFVDITVNLGAKSMGSHFGIFTHRDNNDKVLRKERRRQNIEGWHEIATYAKKKGLQFLTWEPMSINREQGETIEATRKLNEDVNKGSPLPFYLCLDVDHGDLSSKNPDDTDPYKWIIEFSSISPIIHLKQSYQNKGGHWPFTKEHNAKGKIIPEKVIKYLKDNGANNTELLLELSFKEREPFDSTVKEVLKESVNYWRKHIV